MALLHLRDDPGNQGKTHWKHADGARRRGGCTTLKLQPMAPALPAHCLWLLRLTGFPPFFFHLVTLSICRGPGWRFSSTAPAAATAAGATATAIAIATGGAAARRAARARLAGLARRAGRARRAAAATAVRARGSSCSCPRRSSGPAGCVYLKPPAGVSFLSQTTAGPGRRGDTALTAAERCVAPRRQTRHAAPRLASCLCGLKLCAASQSDTGPLLSTSPLAEGGEPLKGVLGRPGLSMRSGTRGGMAHVATGHRRRAAQAAAVGCTPAICVPVRRGRPTGGVVRWHERREAAAAVLRPGMWSDELYECAPFSAGGQPMCGVGGPHSHQSDITRVGKSA